MGETKFCGNNNEHLPHGWLQSYGNSAAVYECKGVWLVV